MTESKITPPPELVQQWAEKWHHSKVKHVELQAFIAAEAAQYGADQELKACCEWLSIASNHGLGLSFSKILPEKLRAARRGKPPSLKQQAMTVLEDTDLPAARYNILLRALEALHDD